jgi:hypothetical protein
VSSRRDLIRASDADREQIAQRLHTAASEGRLLADELDERLTALFASRTYGELDRLVEDLPAPALTVAPRRRPVPTRVWAGAATVLAALVAVLSMATLRVHAGESANGHIQFSHGPGPAAFPVAAALLAVCVLIAVRLTIRHNARRLGS